MAELRNRGKTPGGDGAQDAVTPAPQPSPRHQKSSPLRVVLVLTVTVIAAAVGAHQLDLMAVPQVQQLQDLLQPLQQQLSPYLDKLSAQIASMKSSSGSSSSSSSSSNIEAGRLFTKEELSLYTGGREPHHKKEIYIAILGQVFDVSTMPKFYGPGEGYAHFAGTDGSKSFITGDFVGDVTDDVSGLEPEACLGLTGWADFYHKTYPYKGKLIGRFYDAAGAATPELASLQARAAEGEALKAAREAEEANWPSCNSRWTQEEGGKVWCDGELYPRKLFVAMTNGRASWRCACFKELGWSDVRKVYAGCAPDAHSCSTDPEAEAADEEEDVAADIEAMLT